MAYRLGLSHVKVPLVSTPEPPTRCHPAIRPDRSRFPLAWLGVVLLALAGCEDAPPPPSLPLADPMSGGWFWRDVLAAPLPGEAPPQATALDGATPSQRIAALDGLVAASLDSQDDRQADAALTTLMAALRDPSEAVAIVAADGLGRLGHPGAIPRLIKGLGPYPVDYDTPIAVRMAEAAALARLGSPAGVPLLLSLLAEDTVFQVERGKLEWQETDRLVFLRELALPGIVALAGQDFGHIPNGSVPSREAAYSRMSAWWAERKIPLWNAFDPTGNEGLRQRLRLMIAHLGAYQLRQIDGARFTLARAGPGVLPLLREGLASDDTYVRVHVLEVMELMARDVGGLDAKTRARLAVTAAVPLMDDSQPTVAVQAARVCAAVGEVSPLVAALRKRFEPEVLLAVVDALGATGLPLANTELTAWVPGGGQAPPGTLAPDLIVAIEAALLATDSDRSLDHLLDLLASEDPAIAYPAVERLIMLTGSDHGVDPSAPSGDRQAPLAAARKALANR